jgi:hypothetical protein
MLLFVGYAESQVPTKPKKRQPVRHIFVSYCHDTSAGNSMREGKRSSVLPFKASIRFSGTGNGRLNPCSVAGKKSLLLLVSPCTQTQQLGSSTRIKETAVEDILWADLVRLPQHQNLTCLHLARRGRQASPRLSWDHSYTERVALVPQIQVVAHRDLLSPGATPPARNSEVHAQCEESNVSD